MEPDAIDDYTRPLTLYKLAYCCRLYAEVTGFDKAYREMREALGQNPDLASPPQQDALMRFLNDWRCRIPEKNFGTLRTSLRTWASKWIGKLPTVERDIRSLTPTERTQIGDSYEALLRLGHGLHFQDTAAAKTLHAVRPNTLPIWDSKIKDRFAAKRGRTQRTAGQLYSEFLCEVADDISELEQDLTRLKRALGDVPELVERRSSSLVKLIDEYYWTTITENHKVPTCDELEKWLAWSR